jgi:acyl dehydratase
LTVDVSALPDHVDTDLGQTEWRTMEQQRVDAFADITEDHNPIHVDPSFAAQTPFGGTIAHGYLTLAMVAPLVGELLAVEGASVSINYGIDKLRFPAPLPVGARYRASGRLVGVEEVAGGFQVQVAIKIEVDGSDKPALVATCLFRHYS